MVDEDKVVGRLLGLTREIESLESRLKEVERTVQNIPVRGETMDTFFSSAMFQVFFIYAVDANYLVGNPYDMIAGAASSKQVAIAKPWKLRVTPFDGQTINGISYVYSSHVQRTATNADADEEIQVVVPDYLAGTDYVLAVYCPQGTAVADWNSKATIWQDVNYDGRAWARQHGQTG
jgi:hypothetical protein